MKQKNVSYETNHVHQRHTHTHTSYSFHIHIHIHIHHRFLKTPQQIRVQKSEPVSAESPAQTPPQDDDAAQGQSPFCDRDTPEHSPPREFSGDKVSPGSVPPQLVASQ